MGFKNCDIDRYRYRIIRDIREIRFIRSVRSIRFPRAGFAGGNPFSIVTAIKGDDLAIPTCFLDFCSFFTSLWFGEGRTFLICGDPGSIFTAMGYNW
jgi:hypothetical protein